MKGFVLMILSLFLLASCNVNKYTNIYINNQNNYPIEVVIKTNNIETKHQVAANSILEELRNFTDIEKKDGQWIITINNANTHKGKTYEHGRFFTGDLANHFSMKTKGSYVELSVDN